MASSPSTNTGPRGMETNGAFSAAGSSVAINQGPQTMTRRNRRTAIIPACSRGVQSNPSKRVVSPPPSSVPRLQTAWKDDMIGLWYACSIRAAWAFIATSIIPEAPPISSKTGANKARVGINRIRGRQHCIRIPPARINLLLPKRWIRFPVRSIMLTAPIAGNRSANPVRASPISSFRWSQGK